MENPLRVIQNRGQRISAAPYRHIVLDRFFTEEFYQDLAVAFRERLSRGLTETFSRERFSRVAHYDAYYWSIDPSLQYPFSFFYTPEWDQYLAELFGLPSSKGAVVALHHHAVGSEDGWIHNDYTLQPFVNRKRPDGMTVWYHDIPELVSENELPPGWHQSMRALSVILYVANTPERREGDGGETGMYVAESGGRLVKKVAPLNNRLFAFEVSPFSFHGFLRNVRHERNSIQLWLHQEPEIAYRKFGVREVIAWEENPHPVFQGVSV